MAFPEEERAVSNAVASRKREFRTGRACARLALRELGVPTSNLVKKKDGSTHWPNGTVGSISHCHTWCAAAVARKDQIRGVGIDLELLGRMTDAIALRVLNDEEMARIRHPGSEAASPGRELDFYAWATILFSAKESLFKCLYPLVGRWFGFEAAEIRWGSGPGELCVDIEKSLREHIPDGEGFKCRYQVWDNAVATGLVLVNTG